MAQRSKLSKDLTDDFLSDRMDEDRAEGTERFGQRSKHHQRNKTARTAEQRDESGGVSALPVGRVIQVFSRLSEVVGDDGSIRLCGARKTLGQRGDTHVVVGDCVRYRDDPALDASGKRAGTIERVDPRLTILTRADSFKAQTTHPIVANAQQMLIVAAVVMPAVKWGLIDRMIIAARSGKLEPILCLNKIDLLNITTLFDDNPDDEDVGPHAEAESPAAMLLDAREKLSHYRTLGVRTLETSVTTGSGLDEAKATLAGRTTVLAGHSGVGKSSLVRAIEPALADIRVGEISVAHDKGRHTTTSARIYPLTTDSRGGEVIDTPGVKLFGLWNVTPESLDDYFPDVIAEDAPAWRVESYERIVASLGHHRRG